MDSIERYDHLYKMMAEGRDPEKMHIFGHAEKHMFREIAKRDPAMADAWLAMLAPVEWHNYLTEEEAAVFRRGRNMGHGNVPKSASVAEYRRATGMETLFGYLYITERPLHCIEEWPYLSGSNLAYQSIYTRSNYILLD